MARRRRRGAKALPGVETDMMVIAPRREEGRAGAVALHHLEAQHAAIKGDGAVEIGDPQVHVADTGGGGGDLGHGGGTPGRGGTSPR